MDEKHERELMEELKQYDTPTITNVVATYPEQKEFCLGLYHPWQSSWYTNSDLKCIYPELGRLVGHVVTVTFGMPDPACPARSWSDVYHALAEAPKPTVLCIKQNFPERYKKKNGLAGGNMMTAFRSLGCIGIISDGPSRDVDEVRELGMQYLITGVTAGHGPFVIQQVNTPVSICDMDVCPGEMVHMDENGAVKFPRQYLAQIVEKCRLISASEQETQRLFSQTSDPDVMYMIKSK
jgi:Demethylmenaquinone methyltransferase